MLISINIQLQGKKTSNITQYVFYFGGAKQNTKSIVLIQAKRTELNNANTIKCT
jgi:hypothetical protein